MVDVVRAAWTVDEPRARPRGAAQNCQQNKSLKSRWGPCAAGNAVLYYVC